MVVGFETLKVEIARIEIMRADRMSQRTPSSKHVLLPDAFWPRRIITFMITMRIITILLTINLTIIITILITIIIIIIITIVIITIMITSEAASSAEDALKEFRPRPRCQDSSKGGAVEAGCSDSYDVTH